MNLRRMPSDVIGMSKVVPSLSRRGFMSASAAAAAGSTLAAGSVRAEAIQTSSNGLLVGMGRVPVAGREMPAYFARPADVQRPPIILVCMEIFGLHEWVKDITRRIGHLGAFGVAPNYYFRSETNGIDLTKMGDIQKLLPIVNSKAYAELYADLDATLAWAKAQGGDGNRVDMIGFCRGGRNVGVLIDSRCRAPRKRRLSAFRPGSKQRWSFPQRSPGEEWRSAGGFVMRLGDGFSHFAHLLLCQ
jgi:carboxymethylenebutenolidase